MKINGTYDVDGNDIGNGTDASFGQHLGGNQFYQVINLNKTIVLEPDQELDLNVVMDLAKLYENQTGEYLDMDNPDNWSTHDQTKTNVISFLTNNYGRAFTIE
jgi:hypothetical protein